MLDNPPDPPQTGWHEYTWDRWLAMHAYLSRTYPCGTPIEELDVDLQLDPAKFRRPIVLNWSPGIPDELGYAQKGRDVIVYAGDFDTHPGDAVAIRDYKRVEEVALQMYEEDLARSPLERGVVLAQQIELTVGFECNAAGVLPTTRHARLSPAAEREFTPAVPPTPPYLRRHRGPTSAPYQHVHTATNWNLLERQLASTVANTTAPPSPSGRVASRRLLRLVLERLARLAIDDTRNVGLEKAAAALGLSREQSGRLATAGIADLRGLAQALWQAANESEIATQVTRLNEARAAAHREAVQRPAPPLGAEAAQALLDRIAKTVLGRPRATREAR